MKLILESSILDCYPLNLLIVNIALACVDCALAFIAFSQLTRIHMRNQQVGWTRQKDILSVVLEIDIYHQFKPEFICFPEVLHLMIGSSNLGYFVNFMYTIVATCKRWHSWSQAFGFILMACPTILFLAAFLLLLSFWIDLCHQANDEEDNDEENSAQQALLENGKSKPGSSNMDGHRKCYSFQGLHVGSRQKIVIVVVLLVFILMISFALIIWIGAGKNPIDSSLVARVYVDFSAAAVLVLGGGIGCYGLMLFLKLRKVRSEQASSEIWKVSGLTVVSVVSFTSSALVSLLTNIPLFYPWNLKKINGLKALVLLIWYYFIGSTLPSAFVLWVIRELPPPTAIDRQVMPKVLTFVSYEDVRTHHNQHWTTTTTSKNQVSRASPI